MSILDETLEFFQNKEYFDDHAEWISDHIDKFFPNEEIKVFHEMITFDFKVHVYFIKPKEYSFNILLTSGMSSLAMQVPNELEDKEQYQYAELMMLLPKDVHFEDVYTGENKNDYIISMLKQTAKFPHHYETWIGIGHSIRASEDLESYGPGTDFVGGLILPSVTFDEDFTEIKREGRIINIYSFFPLYENELMYKIENGYNAFLDVLMKTDTKEILDNNRQNLFAKKSFWSRFKS
ncbi:suppressor of fused domain protein [Flavobacterium pedocola]